MNEIEKLGLAVAAATVASLLLGYLRDLWKSVDLYMREVPSVAQKPPDHDLANPLTCPLCHPKNPVAQMVDRFHGDACRRAREHADHWPVSH